MRIQYALLTIAASLAISAAPSRAEDAPPVSVQGTLTIKGQPVAGAKIVFRGPDGKVTELQTDEEGNFVLPNLQPGASQVMIEASGAAPHKNRGKVARKPDSPAAMVTGVVTLDGKPIDQATIAFHPLKAGEQEASAKTNEEGRYQIKLAPGVYKATVAKGNLLPRYDDILRTPLQVEIKEAKNAIDLDLRSN